MNSPDNAMEPTQPTPQSQPAQPAQQGQSNQSNQPNPRQRMKELLAISDRDRTDAQWDELNELEISLASGNRDNGNNNPGNNNNGGGGQGGGRREGQQNRSGGGGGGQGKRPFKKFPKKSGQPQQPQQKKS